MALVAAVGDDPSLFKNGRTLAAWLGLVPRQHSNGGRDRLLGISKRGDVYLRQLLVQGARAVLRWVVRKDDQGQPLGDGAQGAGVAGYLLGTPTADAAPTPTAVIVEALIDVDAPIEKQWIGWPALHWGECCT